MEFILDITGHQKISTESQKSHPYKYLNDIYKDQSLQFDHYGNPNPMKFKGTPVMNMLQMPNIQL